jgi:D-alanyl-lipoteichoic acid acyltransferase DltB (MBOAT superfamily)
MARGTGRMFGITLTENFNSPYLARSIADFWRRWHISFSRWILDYIFKPLQMGWRNWGMAGTAAALLITFLISGVWHGATWGFVIWGLLHGTYLAAATFYRPYQRRLYNWLGIEKSRWIKWWQVFVTFNLVSVAWVFFRAKNLNDALYVVSNCLNGISGLKSRLLYLHGRTELRLTIIALTIYLVLKVYYINYNMINSSGNSRPLVRYMAYNILILSIFFLANYSQRKTFVYFQF